MVTNGSVENDFSPSRIPVAYLIIGYGNNRDAIIDFYRSAKETIDWISDAMEPITCSKITWLHDEMLAARKRGVICKNITDITSKNLSYCKELTTRTDELRHLDGIGVVSGVTDLMSVSMVPSSEKGERSAQFIQSNSESVVRYKQLIFDALWARATPGQLRIDELEERRRPVGGMKSTAQSPPEAKATIDRIYVCGDCRQTFIYSYDVEEHRIINGHKQYREYPIV